MEKPKEGTTKVRMGTSIIQKAKIRYGWAFLSLEISKYGTAKVFVRLKYGWVVILFRKQN